MQIRVLRLAFTYVSNPSSCSIAGKSIQINIECRQVLQALPRTTVSTVPGHFHFRLPTPFVLLSKHFFLHKTLAFTYYKHLSAFPQSPRLSLTLLTSTTKIQSCRCQQGSADSRKRTVQVKFPDRHKESFDTLTTWGDKQKKPSRMQTTSQTTQFNHKQHNQNTNCTISFSFDFVKQCQQTWPSKW